MEASALAGVLLELAKGETVELTPDDATTSTSMGSRDPVAQASRSPCLVTYRRTQILPLFVKVHLGKVRPESPADKKAETRNLGQAGSVGEDHLAFQHQFYLVLKG